MGKRLHDFAHYRAPLIQNSSFRDNLDKCASWLHLLEADAPSDRDFIKTLSSMIEREESHRPTAKEVREFMKTSITADKLQRCGSFCSEQHDNEDAWGLDWSKWKVFLKTWK
jgi:hypothetical protein